MNGCPIAPTQSELTVEQRVFLETVIPEIMTEEREFQMHIHGVKFTRRSNIQNQAVPKNPDEIVADGFKPHKGMKLFKNS